MFLESILALAVLLFVGAFVVGLLKLFLGLVLLPVKIALWLAHGLLALVIGLPVLLLAGLLLGAVLPAVLLVFVVPIWILGAVIGFFFC